MTRKIKNTIIILIVALAIIIGGVFSAVHFGLFKGDNDGSASSVPTVASVASVSSVIKDDSSKKEQTVTSAPASSKKQTVNSAPPSVAYTESETQLPSGDKVCYLTFDDGPSKNTLRVLEILDKYDVKATFFVIGTAKLEYIDNILAQGSKVGLHCNNHKYSACYASESAYFNDLAAISAKVEKYTGEKPDIIRFPGGSSNTVSRKYCKGLMTRLSGAVREKGYQYFDWNVSSGDANPKPATAAQIVNNVVNGAKNRDRVCVLMHDTAAKNSTVEALPQMIEKLKAMGFRFDVLSSDMSGFHHGINN